MIGIIFMTELFQITIMFNYPATLQIEDFKNSAVIELAYLLYEGDYRKVIADAQDILLDYKENYSFKPEKLRCIDYHIEGCIGKRVDPEVYENYLHGGYNNTVFFFPKKAALKNWTKDTQEKYFIHIFKDSFYMNKLIIYLIFKK